MVKTIAYIAYLIIIFASSIITGTANLGMRNWQSWAILLCLIGCYICGYVGGI
jgi:hypothetical protein